jgi:hypothetical protein
VGNWSAEGVINADNLFTQNSAPVITITKNPNRSVSNSNVTFTATASDPDGVASIWCSLGNNAATNGGTTSCSQTATSSTMFYAYAVDNLGNSGILHPFTSSVTIDADIPSITNATPQNGFTPNWTGSSGPITFSWQQVEGVSSYEIFISVVGSPKDYEIPVTCTTSTCTYTTPSSMSFTYFDSGFWQIASIVGNVEHWSDRISFYAQPPQ